MTQNTETIENTVQTPEYNPTTYEDVVTVLRTTFDTIVRYEVTTTQINLSEIPEYTLIQTMIKTNPNLDVYAACKLLNINDNNTQKIIEVIDYYKTQDTRLNEIDDLMSKIKTAMLNRDLIKSLSTKTRAPSTSTGQRKKICGHFYGKCPKCDYIARGKEKSLVTNQIKLHMMKEHGLTLEEFNELYRNTVNETVEHDGETWVEYY